MAKHNSHTDPKWDDLLNAYRQGTISPDALHKLEKAALDDPFLFDAMEGYELHRSSSDSKNIQALATFSNKEKTKIRPIKFFQWSSAAAILLLLVAVTFFMRNQFANEEMTVAAHTSSTDADQSDPIASVIDQEEAETEGLQEESAQSDVVDDFSALNKSSVEIPSNANKEYEVSTSTPTPPATKIPKPRQESTELGKDIATTEDSRVIESPAVESFNLNVEEESQSMPPTSQVFAGGGAKKKKSNFLSDNKLERKEMSSFIKGEIVDQNGLPLIGANVNIENTAVGTFTDVKGNFALPTYPSGIQMVTTYVGYEPSYTMIQSDSFYSITLTENQMLDEIVVADYSIPATEKEVIPEVGYNGLEKFIEQYKNIPIYAFSANYKGSITVEFMINEDGTLSDFNSNDEGCDTCINEAIRLLKLAGKWKTIPEGIKRKAVYTISF